MRSKDRINSQGVGRSMGYGFVEFTTHEAALAVVRAVSNNPSVFGPHKVVCIICTSMAICGHTAVPNYPLIIHVCCITGQVTFVVCKEPQH